MRSTTGRHSIPRKRADSFAPPWLAAFLAALVLVVATGIPVLALAPGSFESSDGNMVRDDDHDWEDHTATATTGTDQPSGTGDNSYSGGTDEDDENPALSTGSIPNKDNLLRFHALADHEAGADFLYLAWVRAPSQQGTSPGGSAHINFELNQSGTTVNGTPVRTVGDVLIAYDFGGSGSPVLHISRWIEPADKSDCESNKDRPACWGNFQLLDGLLADGGVNTGETPIDDVFNPGETLAQHTFGEAAINLTLLQSQLGICVSSNSVFAKSRASGSSFMSQLKDIILPVSFPLDSCGSIKAVKYHDRNANGADDSEPRLAGWTFFIDKNSNGVLDAGETSGVSDANGEVLFGGLLPGQTFTVCEVAQTNWTNSDPGSATTVPGKICKDVNVTGASTFEVKFGNYTTGSISGKKFEDADGPGPGTSGDGLSGWTIKLYVDSNSDGKLDGSDTQPGGFPQTATTDGDGNYSFTGLDPGDYVVCEVLETDYTQSHPANTKCDATGVEDGGHSVTVLSQGSHTGNDFGNYRKAGISGKKFEDDDGKGPGVTGSGLGGWTIEVYADTDGDGSLSAAEKAAGPVATTTTASSNSVGSYSFPNLDPGNYVVCEVLQNDWFQSHPDNTLCDGAGGHAATLSSGGSSTGNDFGNYRKASVAGKKFHDLDQDGSSAGEPGLSGWTIKLYQDLNGDGELTGADFPQPANWPKETTTGGGGAYSFTDLEPGKYVVCEVGQTGWEQTAPGTGVCAGATGVEANGHALNLVSGSALADKDFGNFEIPAGSISGRKFHDLNGNGDDENGGYPGIQGWGISLYKDEVGVLTLVDSTTTGANGLYTFTDLGPGDYVVCENAEGPSGTGWIQSHPASGADCTAVNGFADHGHETTLATATSSVTGLDFGNYRKATIAVEKATVPAGSTQTFVFTGDLAGSIGDGGTIGDQVEPGTYSSQETVPGGWFLDDITCTSAEGSGNVASATATFEVLSGDDVTCTFTNEMVPAAAQARKVTSPAGSEAGWELILSGPGAPQGGEKVTTSGAGFESFQTPLEEGSYTITETAKPGWDQTGAAGCSFTVEYPRDAGEVFQCTLTNTKQPDPPPPGTIVVTKETLPDGSAQTFDFSGAITATLSDGQSQSATVAAGTYQVTEAATAGWDLTDVACVDSFSTGTASSGDVGTATATFNVSPGETVTCTFTNTQRGTIVVEKETIPDDATQTFGFSGAITATLGHGDSASAEVTPGTYQVTEAAVTNWTLTGISCTDSDAGGTPSSGSVANASATYNVDPGETVTCVFTNVEDEVLTIRTPKPPPPEEEEEEEQVLGKVLAKTGADPSWLVALAGMFMLSGGALVLGARRRRRYGETR